LNPSVGHIDRQLVKSGRKPEFGPTKTDKTRSLGLSSDTVAILREHKREQSELKLANATYEASWISCPR